MVRQRLLMERQQQGKIRYRKPVDAAVTVMAEVEDGTSTVSSVWSERANPLVEEVEEGEEAGSEEWSQTGGSGEAGSNESLASSSDGGGASRPGPEGPTLNARRPRPPKHAGISDKEKALFALPTPFTWLGDPIDVCLLWWFIWLSCTPSLSGGVSPTHLQSLCARRFACLLMLVPFYSDLRPETGKQPISPSLLLALSPPPEQEYGGFNRPMDKQETFQGRFEFSR